MDLFASSVTQEQAREVLKPLRGSIPYKFFKKILFRIHRTQEKHFLPSDTMPHSAPGYVQSRVRKRFEEVRNETASSSVKDVWEGKMNDEDFHLTCLSINPDRFDGFGRMEESAKDALHSILWCTPLSECLLFRGESLFTLDLCPPVDQKVVDSVVFSTLRDYGHRVIRMPNGKAAIDFAATGKDRFPTSIVKDVRDEILARLDTANGILYRINSEMPGCGEALRSLSAMISSLDKCPEDAQQEAANRFYTSLRETCEKLCTGAASRPEVVLAIVTYLTMEYIRAIQTIVYTSARCFRYGAPRFDPLGDVEAHGLVREVALRVVGLNPSVDKDGKIQQLVVSDPLLFSSCLFVLTVDKFDIGIADLEKAKQRTEASLEILVKMLYSSGPGPMEST